MSPASSAQQRTRRVTEIGIGVALSTVLSMVVVYRMPQGGSVTLGSLAPLWLLSLRHGVRTGALAGFAHGLLQAMTGSMIIHPLQAILDYLLAYAAQGLVGLARGAGRRRLVLAVLLAVAGRLLAHGLGSTYFLPASLGWSELVLASLSYNAPFVLADGVVAGLVLGALLRARPGLAGECPIGGTR